MSWRQGPRSDTSCVRGPKAQLGDASGRVSEDAVGEGEMAMCETLKL